MPKDTILYVELQQITMHGDNQFIIYGNRAYTISELILKPYCNRVLTAKQVAFNEAMCLVRQEVE